MIVLGVNSVIATIKNHVNKNDKRNSVDIENNDNNILQGRYSIVDDDKKKSISHDNDYWSSRCFDLKLPHTQRLVAFVIGIVHGIAGPGAILGVIPALEMDNWQSSFLYLSCFILTSTLCMGIFASLFGEATRRAGSTSKFVEFSISILSSLFSVFVGVMWIFLSFTGKLDDYFH
jgi:hypothetical protein